MACFSLSASLLITLSLKQLAPAAGLCTVVPSGSWPVLFLIQVWALLPPPQGGPLEAASSHCPVT